MMHVKLDIRLDPTLGCGQAHRWHREADGRWQGVIGKDIITMTQTEDGFECEGCTDRGSLMEYFRAGDDLDMIVTEISERDPYVASLSEMCPGLRILKQPEWECLATYVLATNANVKRIGKMVESVCDHFGTDLGPRRAFPTPGQILDKADELPECRLGFREGRFLELAHRMEEGEIDLDSMKMLPYEELVSGLQGIKGVGPKVADCVAIFGFGRMEAFPVDVRIQKVMESRYGITGSYARVSSEGRKMFGRYAGYAQELLYHSGLIGQA